MVSEGIPRQVQLPQIWSAIKHIRQPLQSRQTKVTCHTTSQCTASHTHTHTHTHARARAHTYMYVRSQHVCVSISTPWRHTDVTTSRLSSSLLAAKRTVSSARHFSSVKLSSPFPLTFRTISVRWNRGGNLKGGRRGGGSMKGGRGGGDDRAAESASMHVWIYKDTYICTYTLYTVRTNHTLRST